MRLLARVQRLPTYIFIRPILIIPPSLRPKNGDCNYHRQHLRFAVHRCGGLFGVSLFETNYTDR